ncbi:MAG TPA: oligosaccharide flippase family protein [Patescibacteria group bacterium]|nr:oligosaccharide flippase family protein [Patescibacteria group bacterium]
MEDFTFESIARKSVKGVAALISRTFLIQLLSIFASFVLTIFLAPADYGVFFVVSSIIVFLTYFQDVGLAAALIQKKDSPSVEELRTTFTLQQILVAIVVIPTIVFSSQIAHFYHITNSGFILFEALIFSFIISSLRTIPTVIMERNLDYNRLVIPEIAENLVYNLALIIFAAKGFGVTTFTIAVIARSIVGFVATYYVQPWPIGFSFHFSSIKKLFSFGVPYQTNTILALFKDDLLTVYIGKVLPFAQVGYIGFAEKWAYMPLRLVMDNVIRIAFPSMSRLQHDKEAMKVAIEKSLFLISFFIFPIVVAIVSFSPDLVSFIPKYEKWRPALIALSFYSLSTIFSSISTPLTNFLTAIGKVKITLYFMIFWTVATWIVTPFFIFKFGYNGVAAGSFLISFTSLFVFVISKRYLEFSFFRPVARQIIAAAVMYIFVMITKVFIVSFPALLIDAIASFCIYLLFLIIFAKDELRKTFGFILGSIKSK